MNMGYQIISFGNALGAPQLQHCCAAAKGSARGNCGQPLFSFVVLCCSVCWCLLRFVLCFPPCMVLVVIIPSQKRGRKRPVPKIAYFRNWPLSPALCDGMITTRTIYGGKHNTKRNKHQHTSNHKKTQNTSRGVAVPHGTSTACPRNIHTV